MLSGRLAPFLVALLVLSLACGGSAPAVRDGPGVPGPAGASPVGVAASPAPPTPFVTATPWPTFTPVSPPTPTPEPVPTARPAPTSTPWPRNPQGGALRPPRVGVAPEDPALPVSPGDMGAHLSKQALVPFWGGDLPDYLAAMDWDRMPDPQDVVGSVTPYMLWVVVFDFSEAPAGYEISGLIRWWSIRPGVAPIVMFETPVTLSQRLPFFYHGLGADDPGMWQPGFYRVEFLDGRREIIAQADFEVRS